MKKKLFSLFLSLIMCLSLFPVVAIADEERDTSAEETIAADLKLLGLFKGVSDTDFALGRTPDRTEALVMLIRIMGKESEAINGNWKHPFKDVPTWANSYVGYAYQSGLTNGVADNRFGAGDVATSTMYVTFMLRSLGYSDADGRDFTWNNPFDLAREKNLIPEGTNLDSFWRADVVRISYAALGAKLKNSEQTLLEKLVSDDVFTDNLAKEIYDPRKLEDKAYLDFISGYEKGYFPQYNSPASENGLNGARIYIEGVLNGIDEIEIEGDKIILGGIIDEFDHPWLIGLNFTSVSSVYDYEKFIGKKILVKSRYVDRLNSHEVPFVLVYDLISEDGNTLEEYSIGMVKLDEKRVTLYALDGRTITVWDDEVDDYLAVGWYETLPERITLYASNHRTIEVYPSEVETYLGLGWSKTPSNVVTPLRIYPDISIHHDFLDGVTLYMYWNSHSDKDIKYIHFSFTPYNRVGDKVKCKLTGQISVVCSETGPFSKPNSSNIGDKSTYRRYLVDGDMAFIYADGKRYEPLRGSTGYIPDDYSPDDMFRISRWDGVWYNEDIESVVITQVKIEYMDGTSVTLTGQALQACIY